MAAVIYRFPDLFLDENKASKVSDFKWYWLFVMIRLEELGKTNKDEEARRRWFDVLKPWLNVELYSKEKGNEKVKPKVVPGRFGSGIESEESVQEKVNRGPNIEFKEEEYINADYDEDIKAMKEGKFDANYVKQRSMKKSGLKIDDLDFIK